MYLHVNNIAMIPLYKNNDIIRKNNNDIIRKNNNDMLK